MSCFESDARLQRPRLSRRHFVSVLNYHIGNSGDVDACAIQKSAPRRKWLTLGVLYCISARGIG